MVVASLSFLSVSAGVAGLAPIGEATSSAQDVVEGVKVCAAAFIPSEEVSGLEMRSASEVESEVEVVEPVGLVVDSSEAMMILKGL